MEEEDEEGDEKYTLIPWTWPMSEDVIFTSKGRSGTNASINKYINKCLYLENFLKTE